MQSNIGFLISNYLFQIPIFIVWVAGIALFITRWQRHPRVSKLALIGLVLSLARALIFPFLQLLVIQSGNDLSTTGLLNGILGLVSAIIVAIAWGFILAAVLVNREPAAVGQP